MNLEYLLQASEDREADQEITDERSEQEQQKWIRDHKSTQLHCLFQMLVYLLHNGKQVTPLHMMLGHAIYARD